MRGGGGEKEAGVKLQFSPSQEATGKTVASKENIDLMMFTENTMRETCK